MTGVEKATAYIGIAVFLVGVGISWNSLNNRIDRVDEKIAGIQKTLGSTACTAILTRQIEAIELQREEAREALEALSTQYGCVPRRSGDPLTWTVDDAANAVAMSADNVSALETDLNAVDVLLDKEN